MGAGKSRGARPGRAAWIAGVLAVAALAVPSAASSHIERPSYWPNPAPDCSIHPCAGGKVPRARSLASALRRKPPGSTQVVCKRRSMSLLRRSARRARRHGYDIRPTDHRALSKHRAKRLLRINRKLSARCRFHQIQAAVNASGNNDRVVIMPGIYTEPHSRAQPTHDPRCAKYVYDYTNDRGQSNGVTYAYQFHCPNDQNLVAVLGRKPGRKPPPSPPLEDRHGIPDLGPCIRCNLQIEGSGVSADDVVIDAGRVASGNGAPADPAKDVGLRADRADGFVLRNLTVRHAKEHAIYVLESDGYLLDRFKAFFGLEYGVLTFVEDHGLMQNCEAAGAGDSGLYPGAGAEGGVQRPPGTPFRYTQEVRFCDSHHNASGFSGTDGNSVHVDHNNFYGNALGFSTDVFTAPGHPGFPQDFDLVEHNNFYSNNFDVYSKQSDVVGTDPFPVGTGLWIAGGNDNVIRHNRFYDNWRRGVMLFAVPDVTVCGPERQGRVPGCDPATTSTSYGNRFYGNVMGEAPGGATAPNGVDFWWDSFVGNRGNCWYRNRTPPGLDLVTSPANLPDCANGTDPSSSVGTGNPEFVELYACLAGFTANGFDPSTCPWFKTPPKPRR